MTKKLIIIDDDPIFVATLNMIYTRVLESQEDALSFTSPAEALNRLTEDESPLFKQDCVLLCDLNMPNIDGFNFLERLSTFLTEHLLMDKIRLQVHVLSSSVSRFDKEKAAASPFINSYLTKPLSPKQLSELLQ